MPLRANKGLPITVEPSSPPELLFGLAANVKVLPEARLLGPTPPRAPLPVQPVRQLREMWCWAACARMVVRFFGAPLEQCQIAGRKFDRVCCPSADSPECDVGCTVEEIDEAFGLAGLVARRIDRPASFEEVAEQVDGNPRRPLVASVQWAGGGGHVVVVSGCRVVDDIRYVTVNDPFYGPGDIRYSDLRTRYGRNDTGVWQHTWLDFSRPQGGA